MAHTEVKKKKKIHSTETVSGESQASQVALVVKNPPANAGDQGDTVKIPSQGDAPEEEMAAHSGIVAWRMP